MKTSENVLSDISNLYHVQVFLNIFKIVILMNLLIPLWNIVANLLALTQFVCWQNYILNQWIYFSETL